MRREPVASSNVASIGYDPGSQTLEVEFHSGRVYQYLDVPEHVHQAFMGAESKGKFLHYEIKSGYRCVRL